MECEILRHDPTSGSITQFQFSIILSHLNLRIRSHRLSAREVFQIDQFTNMELPVSDRELAIEQNEQRSKNHSHSKRAKTPMKTTTASYNIRVGDLVYLYCDWHKSRARDRYLVVSLDGKWCNISKFVCKQLRSKYYRVKKVECYKVKCSIHPPDRPDIPLEMLDPYINTDTKPTGTNESASTDTDTIIADQRPKRFRQMPHHFKDYIPG